MIVSGLTGDCREAARRDSLPRYIPLHQLSGPTEL